jgi:DNA invertase Pin-like site-specific DNA recombinase
MRDFRRRARGKQGGRPRRLDEKKLKMLHALYADKGNSVADILATLNISRSTLYRYIKADEADKRR